MPYFVSKGELRVMLQEYRERIAALVHENYQLRRSLERVQLCLDAANEHHRNTENFLAVLQGDHVADTTEPN